MKVFIIAFLVCSAFALEFDRPCRKDVGAKENFLAIVYEGTWMETQNSEDQGADCVRHHYTRRPILSQFDVVRDAFFRNVWHHETGTAFIAFPDQTPMRAVFNATINRVTGTPITFNYQIVATDYSNYAVTWSCVDLPNNRSDENGAVLARSLPFSAVTNQKITDLLTQIGLDRTEFRTISHNETYCLLPPRP